MNYKKHLLVIMVAVLSINITGCIGVNRNFKQIRATLTESFDADFEKKFEFSVGRAGLSLAGMIIRLTDVEEPIDELLSKVSQVQIGIYEKGKYGEMNAKYEDLIKVTDMMEERGWTYIVRSVQKEELAAVFIKEKDEELNQLCVISFDGSEMVLVEVHGDLEEIVEIVIREKGLNFEMANN